MSCLDKLVYLPSIPAFDSHMRDLGPTIIESLADQAKFGLIQSTLALIKPQITTKIGDKLSLFISINTGSAVANILQGQPFSSAFGMSIINVQASLGSHYTFLDELFLCELNSIDTNLINTAETNQLQSSILSINDQVINNLGNSDIKNLVENPITSSNFLNALTNDTLTTGAIIIASATSNSSQIAQQLVILEALENL